MGDLTNFLLSVEVGNVGHRPVAVGMERRKSATIVVVEEGGVAAVDGGKGGGFGGAVVRGRAGGSFDGVLACPVVELEEGPGFDALGKNRRSDNAVEKEVADTPTIVDAWIRAISCVHKNWAMMMVPRSEVREATSLAMKEMEPSLHAASIDDGLRPRRISSQLTAADVMGDLDRPIQCPSLMGLPEMKEAVVTVVGTVETSSSLTGGYQI
ncbi:hypothetical protein ACLOJK_024049 [Asimina triloba]